MVVSGDLGSPLLFTGQKVQFLRPPHKNERKFLVGRQFTWQNRGFRNPSTGFDSPPVHLTFIKQLILFKKSSFCFNILFPPCICGFLCYFCPSFRRQLFRPSPPAPQPPQPSKRYGGGILLFSQFSDGQLYYLSGYRVFVFYFLACALQHTHNMAFSIVLVNSQIFQTDPLPIFRCP